MDINEIFSKLGELLSYGEYEKVASVCERLISTGYKEKEIHLVQFLAEAKVKDINDLPDSEEELDKLKSYSYITSEFEPDMVNYVIECNDYIHSRKMSELDSLTKEDSAVTELVSKKDDSVDDLFKSEPEEDEDIKIRTKSSDRYANEAADEDDGPITPMKKIDTIGGDDDYSDNQSYSGGVDRFSGSEDRFSLEEDRYSNKSSRYENIGDEYGDQYSDQYGDSYGNQYGDQYSDQYDNYEDDEYDMPRSRKKKKNKRKDKYADEYNDQYDDQYGDQDQYQDQYNDQYGDPYGNQYGDEDYDDLDEEGPAIDFILFIIAVVLGVADIASLIFAIVSGAFG